MNYRLPNLNRFGQTLEEFYNSPEQLENCNCSLDSGRFLYCSPGQWAARRRSVTLLLVVRVEKS